MKKHLVIAILILISAGAGWIGYQYSYPTTLVAIHKVGKVDHMSIVLISNPPLTDAGKITWWQKNEAFLKNKYNIPSPNAEGRFYISIWDFAEGYKEVEKYDRLCFDDMKKKENCIDKNWVMTIEDNRKGRLQYKIGEGSYIEEANGKLIKQKD
ncbi:DUF943 family protein [Paramixta manurensis]|uniref:DUF943 family protein n=1 Tax=Paramixta manurensis TaxID=2740817 RepID=A0A6M8UNL4_9GAMM|nr:DUF943 family protein [Erwiniaceae bacterium PD-1]